ncbi:hypothetical protein FPOAC1_005642 [Fusarium poae]|uniref:hypothetical protein n=1 Tax=Fusarium poae TaxID=36050 RepID=UPI001CE8B1A6|nr:hypothetical protein FPOAC1_005642 [Fusarium poae]KAG8672375.1 hypothetical protein FPOAC1_005642 [Fusarium poae]
MKKEGWEGVLEALDPKVLPFVLKIEFPHMSLFIMISGPIMKQPQSLTKTSNPALIRRRRERAHPCQVDPDPLESSIFPPRRCNFAGRPPGSSHRVRHSIQDVQHTGLPLCDVVLFQNATIPSPLACKPPSIRDNLSQLKVGSRAPSLRSPTTPACSIRSRSARASMRDAYEARTWRNKLRRHSVSEITRIESVLHFMLHKRNSQVA